MMLKSLRTETFVVALAAFVGSVTTPAFGQNIITNGDFEDTPFDSGWTGNANGGAELHAGIAPGSTQAAKVVGSNWLAQNEGANDVITGPDWEMDVYFAGSSGGGNRYFNIIIPQANAINGGAFINQRVDNLGNLQVFGGFDTGLFWQTIASGFEESVDFNEDGDFDDPEDTLNVYHYNIKGFGFGTPGASYDVFLSDANNDELVLRGNGVRFFQDALARAQDPERPGVTGLSLSREFAEGAGITVFDNVVMRGIGNTIDNPEQWSGPGGGDWNDAGSWIGPIPNAAGSAARFGANIEEDSTVNLNSAITVGSIEFAGSNLYTIAGGNTLTLEGDGTITVPTISSGAEISATIGGSVGLTKEGAGTLVLSGNNTFTGDVVMQRGSLSVSSDSGFGNSANSLSFNGGGLQVTGNTFANTARTMTFGDAGGQFDIVDELHTFTVSQTLSGAGGIAKFGLGTLQLSAANTFTGISQVIDGALAVNNPNALGDASAATILAGGESTGRLLLNSTGTVAETLELGGRASDQSPHIVNQAGTNTLSGTLNVTGGGFIRFDSEAGNLNFGGDLANNSSNVTLVLGGAGNGEFSGTFSRGENAVTGLTKTGTGTWAITNGSGDSAEQPNGIVLIELGTLEVHDTQAPDQGELAASNITVLAGGVFDVEAFGTYSLQPNQSLSGDGTVRASTLSVAGDNLIRPGTSAGTMTIEGNATISNAFAVPDQPGGFEFELADETTVGGGTNDLVEVTGSLTFNSTSGDVNISILPISTSGLATGTYRLFNAGSISGSASDLTLNNTTRYNMSLATTASQVNLTVSGSNANITWTGATNGAWDINGTQNWDNGGADVFFNADSVTFDDSATNKTLDLAETVLPSSININNSAGNDYTISGAGSISGGTAINKQGTGAVSISTANDFDGDVTVSGGTLHAAANTALGSVIGGTTVMNGATLDVGGADLGDEQVTVSGAGVGGQGAITSSAGSPGSFRNVRFVTLTGDTTFGAIGETDRWDIRSLDEDTPASLNGGGHSLNKEGAGIASITDVGETDLGDITINGGSLVFQFSSTLGQAGSVTVNDGGELGLFSNDAERPTPTPSKSIVLNGGTLSNSVGGTGSTGDLNINTPITHVAHSSLEAQGGGALIISTPLTGSGAGISKRGAGTVVLNAANTYDGNTIVEEGTLRLGSAGTGSAGDYNGDGSVGAADYTVFRDTLGSMTDLRADGNGNGVIDDLDYGVWKANYGAGGGATGSIANSPLVVVRSDATFDISQFNSYHIPSAQTVQGAGTVSGNLVASSGSTIDPAAAGPTTTISLLSTQAVRLRYDPDNVAGDAVETAAGLFIGPIRVADVSRSLVEFDLSTIPANVQEVSLVLTKEGNDAARDELVSVEAHKLNVAFVREEATGEFARTGVPWSGPAGGDGLTNPGPDDFGPLLTSVQANSAEYGAASNPGAQLVFPNTPEFLAEVQSSIGTGQSLSLLLKVDDPNEPGTDDDGNDRRNLFRPFGHNHPQGPTLNLVLPVFGGILTVDGDYTQEAGSTLAIDIGGNGDPGFDHDQLGISGNAAINGGTLDVNLVGGYMPSLGDEFDILDFAATSGAGFDTFDLPALTAGLNWDTSNLLTSGVLSIVSGGAGSTVPEPGSCLLLIVGSFALISRRKSRVSPVD